MTDDRRDFLATCAQCAIAIVLGCWTYLALWPDYADGNTRVPLVGGLIVGLGGAWVLSKAFGAFRRWLNQS